MVRNLLLSTGVFWKITDKIVLNNLYHHFKRQLSMKKKRKLTTQEFEAYQKQHDYEDVIAAEETKVRNEKASYARLQKKSKQQLQKQIKLLKTAIDPDEIEDELVIPEEELLANRTIRNARTHKNRLNGLKEYEEE